MGYSYNILRFVFLTLFSLTIIFINTSLSKEEKIISGKPRVIDGDTIKINDKSIRLFGIDAPEKKQKCKKSFLKVNFLNFQKNYSCGSVSTKNLKKKIENKDIECIFRSEDRYGRYLAICYLEKLDINKWMVKNGYALAYKKYSRKYVLEEQYAKDNKLGMWEGTFIEPEKWRRIMN
tara:strand:- start:12775 stop:13305 length:531 start_codon:yes stop_codon:yes gene_type:complete